MMVDLQLLGWCEKVIINHDSVDVEKTKGVDQGSWSSINVIDVKSDASGKKWTYKITSSVVLEMNIV